LDYAFSKKVGDERDSYKKDKASAECYWEFNLEQVLLINLYHYSC